MFDFTFSNARPGTHRLTFRFVSCVWVFVRVYAIWGRRGGGWGGGEEEEEEKEEEEEEER